MEINRMEIPKNGDDFSDPKLYLEVFQGCLERDSCCPQWITLLSIYSQVMKDEIGSFFEQETAEEIDEFISFSLQEKFKSRNLSKNDIGKSKEYLEKIIVVLEDL